MGHGPVDSCGQVRDLDPSLVKTRDLSQVGQVRPVDSCGQVRVKMTGLLGNGVGDGRDGAKLLRSRTRARLTTRSLRARGREAGNNNANGGGGDPTRACDIEESSSELSLYLRPCPA